MSKKQLFLCAETVSANSIVNRVVKKNYFNYDQKIFKSSINFLLLLFFGQESGKVKGAHFPGGLIIDQVNPTSTSATKTWHSSVNSKDRNKQISGL